MRMKPRRRAAARASGRLSRLSSPSAPTPLSRLAVPLLTTLAVLAVLAPARPAAAQQTEQYSVSGHEVAIYDIAGAVQLAAGTGPSVKVVVTRGGSDAGRLRVVTGTADGHQTLRVVYPGHDVHYGEAGWGGTTTIRVRADGTFGAGGHRVRIHGGFGGLDAHADLRVLIPPGKRVAVFLGVGHVTGTGLSGDLLVNVASAGVHIDGMSGALLVDTGSGSVSVSKANGAVRVDAGSGSVDVSDVKGAELRVSTGSGSVHADRLAVATLDLGTGSGSIHALGVSAPKLKLHTGSGGIRLDLTSDVEQASLRTGSGGVRVFVPASLGAQLDIHTGSGGIHAGVPVKVTEVKHSELRGQLGNGAGELKIVTGSGSVRLLPHKS